MKKLKIFSILLSCVAILASCGGGSHEEEDPDDETFEHLKTEDVALGSTSGTLIELGTGKYLEKNQTYSCSFTPSTSIDTNYTVKSYDESVATVTRGTGQVFYIETHKVGDTIIYGYDVDGVLVLRRLVQVRKSYEGDELINQMYNVDKWTSFGIYGTYDLTMLSKNPGTVKIVGEDGAESTTLVYTLDNPVKEKLFDFNFVRFDMVMNREQSITQRTYTYTYFSVTADEILVYYSEGLLEIFRRANSN